MSTTKYTNKYDLSPKLFGTLSAALSNDSYNKGDADFSVTELISPPRQRVLTIMHKHEIVEDITDRLWSLYGQIAHGILERANAGGVVEKRYFAVVNGVKISGQVDVFDDEGDVYDWKFSSAWGFVREKEPKPEYVQQLNMLAFLIETNGEKVRDLHIVAPLRDWMKSKFKIGKGYPAPIVEQDIVRWSREETGRFINTRVYLHLQAVKELPECTPEETWNSRRCADYCSVNKFCEQYQKTKQEQKEVYL